MALFDFVKSRNLKCFYKAYSAFSSFWLQVLIFCEPLQINELLNCQNL